MTSTFAELLVQLAAAYPTTGKLTEASIRLYAWALGDVPLTEVKRACARAIRESRFFPSVAELRQYIVPTPDEAALLAWTALTMAASEIGAYASVDVEDAAAAEALTSVWGSWPAFCAEEEGPALAARRQAFLAAYRDSCRRHRSGAARLPGLCESAGTYDAHRPVLSGRVMRSGAIVLGRDRPLLPAAQQIAAASEARTL